MPRKRRARSVVGCVGVALLTVASSSAGARVPESATLAPLAVPEGVALGPDRGGLARVSSSFINEQLGLPSLVRPGAVQAPTTTKRFACVAGRQTEDPLSPPCEPVATPGNAGATYQGVTSDEIRVVIAAFGDKTLPCGETYGPDVDCNPDVSHAPKNVWFDLDKPVPRSVTFARAMKAYGEYFNRRFQTHGRRVHLYLYFFDPTEYYGATGSRVEAAKIVDALRPFAVILQSPDFSDHMAAELARRGVEVFTDLWNPPQSSSYYAKYPDRLWGYWPAIEQAVESYSSYVCQKVMNEPVVMSGNPGENGRRRKLGLVYGQFHDTRTFKRVATLVRERVTACGGEIVEEGEFITGNGCHTRDYRHVPLREVEMMTRFQQQGVTTVLWPSCVSSALGIAARSIRYFPEWIVLGDYSLDANSPISASGLEASFDKHAVVVTPATVTPPLRQNRCSQAMRAEDPTIPNFDAFWACSNYGQFRLLFTGIQRAGKSLGPFSFGRGLHSLAPVASVDPLTPTCSFADNTTACVRDAMVMYWDSSKATRYNKNRAYGCWRAFEGGRRYLPGAWPPGNIDAQRTGDEPCNSHDNNIDGYLPPDYQHATAGLPLLPETLA